VVLKRAQPDAKGYASFGRWRSAQVAARYAASAEDENEQRAVILWLALLLEERESDGGE